jgi:transcriptional regulator of NAD metabolism
MEEKMQSKKQLILWVLNVLVSSSDKDNPVTQTKIASIISDIYPCDRKTVCRNINFLIEMGYPIIKTNRGYYMDQKDFSVDETEYVKAAILAYGGKTEEERRSLAERVAKALTKIHRRN